MVFKKHSKRILLVFSLALSLNNSILSTEKPLTNSEQFIKKLYKKHPLTITFLRQYEVSSTLANELNKLFTPEIQKALHSRDTKFLIKNGFRFYLGNNIFSHKDFLGYVFKIPKSSECLFTDPDLIKYHDILLNASRIWYGKWIEIVQQDLKPTKKQAFFMKSNFPELSIVVVTTYNKNFKNASTKLTSKERASLKKINCRDPHSNNVRSKFIIDTECWEQEMLKYFLEDPFIIYNDPLKLIQHIKPMNLKSKL